MNESTCWNEIRIVAFLARELVISKEVLGTAIGRNTPIGESPISTCNSQSQGFKLIPVHSIHPFFGYFLSHHQSILPERAGKRVDGRIRGQRPCRVGDDHHPR